MVSFKKIYSYVRRHIIAAHVYFILSTVCLILFYHLWHHYRHKTHPTRKCIVFIPGFMASQLFYNGDSNKFYRKGEALLCRSYKGLSTIISGAKDILKLMEHSDMLLCNSEGLPNDTNIGILRDKSSADELDRLFDKYGTLFLFKNFINLLDNKFGPTTQYKNDIIMFNYDWRLDCSYNANLLINKIIDYDEVIIIAFSLGGLIASKALVTMKQKYSLKNIKAYLSVCVPYNGTINAIRGLKAGYCEYDNFSNLLYDTLSISPKIQKLSRTFPAMYQLLPTKEFFRRNKGFLKNHDGKEMTYFDMWNYFKDTLHLSTSLVNKAIDFHNSLFIKNKYILDYIDNKYFFVGLGYSVPSSVQIHNKKKDLVFLKYSKGDNTVDLYHSAIPPVEDTKSLHIYRTKTLHSKIFDNNDFLDKIFFVLNSLQKKSI